MKKIAVNKSEVDTTIRNITKRMSEINWFVNIKTKPHKDSEKVWINKGGEQPPTDKSMKGNEKHEG